MRYALGIIAVSIAAVLVVPGIWSEDKNTFAVAVFYALFFGLSGAYLIKTRNKKPKTHAVTVGFIGYAISTAILLPLGFLFIPEDIMKPRFGLTIFFTNIAVGCLSGYIYHRRQHPRPKA